MTFDELGLGPLLLGAIADAGYTEPTPIQAAAIPHALAGRDVLGLAQTGTGKTASFTLPMIEMLSRGRAKARMPRSLILTPTRELAAQVSENFEKYGKNHKLTMALLIGGVSFGDQDRLLMQGVDVLIATPGRLLDHFERGKLLLTGVQILVIDEADRMLDMGFIPDIERIVKLTPFQRQTLFFSATMPPEIQRLSDQFLHNPARVEVARRSSTAETVAQFLVRAPSGDPALKRAALRAAIDHAGVTTGIIFCNRKTEVDILAKSLTRHGYGAAPIHGDLAQSVRTETLAKFRAGEITLLVASDVAARGLDIPDVGHVFNFDVPRHAEDYVHRIGRTGRAGRSGQAYTIVAPEDLKGLAAVNALIQKEIPDAEIPALEGAVAAITARPPSRSGDGGARGGRSRSRGGRIDAERGETPAARSSRSRRSSGAGAGEAVAPQPTAVNEVVRERRPERAASASPRGRAADDGGRAPAGAIPPPRRHHQDDGRGSEVGLGAHTPAFLLRAAPAAPPSRRTLERVEAAFAPAEG